MTKNMWTILGTDITYLIVDLLSSDKTHLRQLSLVSHSSRLIAQQHLYREVRLTWSLDRISSFPLFIRTVLSNPSLAHNVRTLRLSGRCPVPYSSKQWFLDIPKNYYEQEFVAACARQLRIPLPDAWTEELRQGSIDALAALLLCHLDCLTCLHIDSDFTASVRWIGALFWLAQDQPSNNPRFLEPIRKVKLELSPRHWTDTSTNRSQDLLSTIYLPNLNNLSLTFDNPPALEWPVDALSISSSLTSLTVAELRETMLGELLSLTPRLRTFKWTFYHRCYDTVDLDELSTALTHVSDTLTSLSLKATMEDGDWQEKPPITLKGSLRQLQNLPRLQKMRAPLEYLAASFDSGSGIPFTDVLPINLESLTITDDFEGSWLVYNWTDSETYLHIARWLANPSRPQRQIREVMLSFEQTDDQWLPDARKAFVELCKPHDIQGRVHKTLLDIPSEWVFCPSGKSIWDAESYPRRRAEFMERQSVSANIG